MAVSAARGSRAARASTMARCWAARRAWRWVPWAASRSRLQAVSSRTLLTASNTARKQRVARRLRDRPVEGRIPPFVSRRGWSLRRSARPAARSARALRRWRAPPPAGPGSAPAGFSPPSPRPGWSGARGRSARPARCGAARRRRCPGPAAAPPVPPPRGTSSAARTARRPTPSRSARVSALPRRQAAGAVGSAGLDHPAQGVEGVAVVAHGD